MHAVRYLIQSYRRFGQQEATDHFVLQSFRKRREIYWHGGRFIDYKHPSSYCRR
jgi:hypothetical protein